MTTSLPEFTDEFLAKRLRVLVDANDTTLTELATSIGVPYRTLQNQLSGNNKMPASTFAKILLRLGVPLDFVTSGRIALDLTMLGPAVDDALGALLPAVDDDLNFVSPPEPDTRSKMERRQHAKMVASAIRSNFEIQTVTQLELPFE